MFGGRGRFGCRLTVLVLLFCSLCFFAVSLNVGMVETKVVLILLRRELVVIQDEWHGTSDAECAEDAGTSGCIFLA